MNPVKRHPRLINREIETLWINNTGKKKYIGTLYTRMNSWSPGSEKEFGQKASSPWHQVSRASKCRDNTWNTCKCLGDFWHALLKWVKSGWRLKRARFGFSNASIDAFEKSFRRLHVFSSQLILLASFGFSSNVKPWHRELIKPVFSFSIPSFKCVALIFKGACKNHSAKLFCWLNMLSIPNWNCWHCLSFHPKTGKTMVWRAWKPVSFSPSCHVSSPYSRSTILRL